jgi:GcrA cell cycle regulator
MMKWTPDRIEELCRLRREGVSVAEIGRRFGISKNAVVGKLDRLRKKSQPPAAIYEVPEPLVITGCRYIEGETAGRHTVYCGMQTVRNSSWCAHHLNIVWQVKPRWAKVLEDNALKWAR